MTPPPGNDPPPNLLKFERRPEAKRADDSQLRKTFRLAIGIVLLIAAALIWHSTVR